MSKREELMNKSHEAQEKICDSIDAYIDRIRAIVDSDQQEEVMIAIIMVGLLGMRFQNHLKQISMLMDLAKVKIEKKHNPEK